MSNALTQKQIQQKLNKYLNIEKHEVKAKTETEIKLNLDNYKEIVEDIKEVEENGHKINKIVLVIPGFIELYFPNEMDSLKISLPYQIELLKNNFSIDKKILTLLYEPGETIFYAEFKTTQTNLRFMDSLIENGIKYLNDDIYQTVLSIYDQMQKINNSLLVHTELIVSNMYGYPLNGEYVPLRVTGKEYSQKYALNTKKSIHNMQKLSGFVFGYSNEYLIKSTSKDTKSGIKNTKKPTYFENIIAGNYHKLQRKKHDD